MYDLSHLHFFFFHPPPISILFFYAGVSISAIYLDAGSKNKLRRYAYHLSKYKTFYFDIKKNHNNSLTFIFIFMFLLLFCEISIIHMVYLGCTCWWSQQRHFLRPYQMYPHYVLQFTLFSFLFSLYWKIFIRQLWQLRTLNSRWSFCSSPRCTDSTNWKRR